MRISYNAEQPLGSSESLLCISIMCVVRYLNISGRNSGITSIVDVDDVVVVVVVAVVVVVVVVVKAMVVVCVIVTRYVYRSILAIIMLQRGVYSYI